ncbi:permease prefix domain 1-containing protein [Enterococcus pallens]|uniref:Beta-carotene 15,15'-monooxygenase n=1 Tax=Enterococcus pallens ATCC BAA-351 TaxID=1158607 RepID=R2SDN0_9ENTE|nr:permease prefix domain 1-containing protein [Enterococcus pallens]EOH93635.1 hypothetical protein UAU_02331 [Enterococcus pallens ATCC BAA-351]EOU24475.1 hypothetical protein I588_00462 [Enterococcus pallens ATCC BAA-351]OJG78640.1 hypothetical protein RV10_GL001422 [Enterococcus pallens]
MDTIKNYLETLFIEFPKTQEVQRAKEELLAIMEDHYWSLREEGKSEHEAIGAVISEFGSVDELKDTLQFSTDEESEVELDQDPISQEEMLEFMAKRKRSSSGLSLGIAFCILSVATILGADIVGYASSLGLAAFFVCVATGVGLIIYNAMQMSSEGKPLNDRFVPKAVQQLAKTERNAYQKSFQFSLVLGIASCVLSLVPVVLFSGFYIYGMGVPLMFVFIAAGVFLIVYGSVYYSSHNKFIDNRYFVLDDDKLGPNARKERYGEAAPIGIILEKVYWPVVVCTYFIWSFLSGSWAFSWIIFVIAGVVHEALISIFRKA